MQNFCNLHTDCNVCDALHAHWRLIHAPSLSTLSRCDVAPTAATMGSPRPNSLSVKRTTHNTSSPTSVETSYEAVDLLPFLPVALMHRARLLVALPPCSVHPGSRCRQPQNKVPRSLPESLCLLFSLWVHILHGRQGQGSDKAQNAFDMSPGSRPAGPGPLTLKALHTLIGAVFGSTFKCSFMILTDAHHGKQKTSASQQCVQNQGFGSEHGNDRYTLQRQDGQPAAN